MSRTGQDIVDLLTQSVSELVARGAFENGWTFRPTQKAALEAYDEFLKREDLSAEDKLKGFFEIPTGVGKTAVFGAIIAGIYKICAERGEEFSTTIAVPTNNLVDQTFDEITEVSPSLKGLVGRYDGRRKESDKPITVTTYDSLITLLEAGIKSAENTDMLVSDEGHRGTSDRRVETMFDAYDSQTGHSTARVAVTATSRFDEDKTVQHSHVNEIFSRPIADCIKAGELAEYISTQFYLIRAVREDEGLVGEFSAAAIPSEERQAMRKEAWNRRMLTILRDGTDKVTDDPLTDNKSAFFVSDTAHADRMEALLNADPVLQERAKAKDLKGVAVSIHSNLSNTVNRQRMKDFKAGKYLVATGDSQFKEGYDDPELKNIFDFPRSSLVDKGQIVGRGARRWHNEAKERYEGMTFIDSVVYVGDSDPDEDRRLREVAIENAILASEILDGVFALREGSHYEPPSNPTPSTGGGAGLFPDDVNVEEYTSLEELHLIESERDQIIAEATSLHITEDMRAKLHAEIARTRVGEKQLLNLGNDALPPFRLTANKIYTWKTGAAVTAKPSHWEWVMSQYSNLDSRIQVTDEMRAKLASEIKRTGVGSVVFFKSNDDTPEDFIERTIERLKNGKTTNISQKSWDYIVSRYETMPDKNYIVTITEDMRNHLNAEMGRVVSGSMGYTIEKLLASEDTPEGLTKDTVKRWKSGKTKTAERERWDWLHNKLKATPSLLELTNSMRSQLSREQERTQTSTMQISRIASFPEGLNTKLIERWKSGAAKMVEPDKWNWVLDTYAALPTKSIQPARERDKVYAEYDNSLDNG